MYNIYVYIYIFNVLEKKRIEWWYARDLEPRRGGGGVHPFTPRPQHHFPADGMTTPSPLIEIVIKFPDMCL